LRLVQSLLAQFLPVASGLRLIGAFVEAAEALIVFLELGVEASKFRHSLCTLPFCTAISQALNKAFSKTKQKTRKNVNLNRLCFKILIPAEEKKVKLIGMQRLSF
jgi:hypothetical protein